MEQVEERLREMIVDRQQQIINEHLKGSPNIAPSTGSIKKAHEVVLNDEYIKQINGQLLELTKIKMPKLVMRIE